MGRSSVASRGEVSQHKNKPCHNAFGLMKNRFSVIKSSFYSSLPSFFALLAGIQVLNCGGIMKKLVFFLLMVVLAGMPGCSVQQIGNSSGIGVMFDGEPVIFDSSVVYMGTVVGRILSREWGNGITRVSITLDSQYEALIKNSLAVVVKNGRMHLHLLSGYGNPLPPGGCISGFVNTSSYRWFKFRHLINDVTMSADRRAQLLLARSGLAG